MSDQQFESTPAPETDEREVVESDTAPESADGTSQADDLGYPEGFDINEVPEEYRDYVSNIERQFKGHYTKKTQDLADQRKTYEEAQPILDWVESLRTDPQAQAEAYAQLQELLDQAGYWNED